jgi:predicted metal-binding membrane protein
VPPTTRPRRTALERAFMHEDALVFAPLALVVLLCAVWIVAMGLDMYGRMNGPSAWMMTMRWRWIDVALLFAMWIAMMTAMMLPAAAPVLLIFAGVVRASGESAATARRVWTLAAGYLAVWAGFSAAATIAQRLLTRATVLTPMMEIDSRMVAAALLVAAGVYQLTPLKRSCLRACRSAAVVVSAGWRPGAGGAFRLGVQHGVVCLGCCWVLMLLLFAGGVMNLYVIGGITAMVAIEKLSPAGVYASPAAGVVLIAAGAWLMKG